ncbi:hypothetical protein Tco_0271080 [Tanacetum coccineum]
MRYKNPICTLGDYSKPSHEGYRNTIELSVGNNMVPLRSDTIQLVQNGCSFHGIQFKDPNQHLKDFLKLVDSLDLNSENKEKYACVYFNFHFMIKLAIGLNVFQQDPSPHGRILLLVSLLNVFHREGLGPHDTQYCMEDPEQAFIKYASSCTDEAVDCFRMVNLNLTLEEYIRLEEVKAHKHGKVFNWQTATYGKIRVDDDFYDLRSMEAEFPAIVVNEDFAPKDTLQCKSQVSIHVNDEIDFRISFDKSDDEDYIIICDKNSFSYKMIFVNNLKTDSENDYEKLMPSIPSPEPAISCFDDLDFFKDFENEFPAIVYNDAQTSKSDLLTKPILNPQHIDEFDLSDEISLSEYDEEE